MKLIACLAPGWQSQDYHSRLQIASEPMIETAMTRTERRSLGRFDTPRPLAQAVTDWAVRSKSDRVLEPSSGGGIIVQSIASRLKELGGDEVGTQIVACDIDPRAMAETSRCVTAALPNLVLGNFLALDLEHLGGRMFDSVVGNPPYVRLHTMDTASREAARRSLPESHLLNAKASLWAYFPLHAFKFLKTGGRMSWILPETLLHSDYGKQMLRWSAQNFSRCIAVSLRERCFKVDGAKERVVILLLEGAGTPAVRETEMVEYESAVECIAALNRMTQNDSPSLPQLNGHAVPHLVSSEAAAAAAALEETGDFIRLGDLATIRIGVVTGDNRFFVMSDQQRKAAKLSTRHFKPVVSRFADLGDGLEHDRVVVKDEPSNQEIRNLLLSPKPESIDKNLLSFMAGYSEEEIKNNKTMQKRPYWQCPTLGQVPHAFLRYMGKSAPRLVLNTAQTYCTNTIHGVFFNDGITETTQRAICLALHSSYCRLSAEFEGRQYGSGVLKLEPSEAARLSVPASASVLSALARKWNQLSKRAKRDGWESIVGEIDETILSNSSRLAKKLPLLRVRAILQRVRQRRTGIILRMVDKTHQ